MDPVFFCRKYFVCYTVIYKKCAVRYPAMQIQGEKNMQDTVLQFFDRQMDALPLYEKFETCIMSRIPDVKIKVQKTQISFYNRHMFACVSFAKVRKKKECPPYYIVVTFGLGYKKESPRIDIATEPYPGRWTHHVLISDPSQIDKELMGWIEEASLFSDGKR